MAVVVALCWVASQLFVQFDFSWPYKLVSSLCLTSADFRGLKMIKWSHRNCSEQLETGEIDLHCIWQVS